MVLSQEASLQDISTLLGPRKAGFIAQLCLGNLPNSYIGWTPSTFVSSRSDRARQQAARPEDFMDEEDLAEIRESRQLVDENEEMDFTGTEGELRKRQGLEQDTENEYVLDLHFFPTYSELITIMWNNSTSSITSALASALAPPPTESAGAKILMKMGWRQGQGIGPRLTYEQRRVQDRSYGISSSLNEDDIDEEAKKHMYPRRDTPILLAPRKENAHGLGYKPGMSLNESLGASGQKASSGPRISSGFGLGALNDADEDDLDVYDNSMGPRGHSKVAFDVIDDEERIAMGSSRRRNRSGVNEVRKTFYLLQLTSMINFFPKGSIIKYHPNLCRWDNRPKRIHIVPRICCLAE